MSSHWLLLVALALYFRLRRRPARLPLLLQAAALVPLALLVHPYLMVMVIALLAAAPASLAFTDTAGAVRPSAALLAGILAAWLLMHVLGYPHTIPEAGFGLFSMNALSPVYPDRSGLFPALSLPYAYLAQADGYNYLGRGLIGLLLAASVQLPASGDRERRYGSCRTRPAS